MTLRVGKNWVRLDDGTIWSFDRHDEEHGSLNWLLRYGTDADVLRAQIAIAGILSSYQALIDAPQKRRNEVVRAIRQAQAAPHKTEELKPK